MKPIMVTNTINKSLNTTWKAITEHSQMVQWFFENIPSFKAIIGFTTQFNVSSEEHNFLHVWKVIEISPKEKITTAWTYPEYLKGSFLVTFELVSKEKNKTVVTVTVKGIEKFEHFNIEEFTRESCVGGWEYFLGRLKEYLEK